MHFRGNESAEDAWNNSQAYWREERPTLDSLPPNLL
jgi:hypothetical protein